MQLPGQGEGSGTASGTAGWRQRPDSIGKSGVQLYFARASAITPPFRRPAERAAVATVKCSISTLNEQNPASRAVARGCSRKGEPNAQAQDQVRRQEALQGDRRREGALSAIPQTPRHDQADEEADPPIARDQRAVQDRRRQHQEILPAQRLNAAAEPTVQSRTRCIEFVGDQPWHASSAASPGTPSTRKSSKPPRAITAGARTPSASPSRRSRRPTNTPIATASAESAPSGRSGSSASMRRCGPSA